MLRTFPADFRTDDRSEATHECNGQFFRVEEHEVLDFRGACKRAGINPQEIGDDSVTDVTDEQEDDSSVAENRDGDSSAAEEQQHNNDDSMAGEQENDNSVAENRDGGGY